MKKCEVCGNKFSFIRSTKRFCSISCRDKNKNSIRRKLKGYFSEVRNCLLCGKEFKVNWKNSKKRCCSRLCTSKHWKISNPDKYKKQVTEYNQKRRSDPEYRKKEYEITARYWQSKKGRFNKYKADARHRKIKFNLSFDEFKSYWNKQCYYCGDKIDGIGLDRIDSLKGYTIDNIIPCCAECNWMKRELSQSVFIEKCNKISSRYGSDGSVSGS